MKKECNFCGRNERQVKLLITGLNGYICEDCARQAFEIVKESGLADPASSKNSKDKFQPKSNVPKPREIKEYLDQHHVYFFGNGAAKCMETINHPNAHLVEGIEPLAKNMAPLAEKRFVEGKFEDVAYFVPFYLKDFVAKMPKKLL